MFILIRLYVEQNNWQEIISAARHLVALGINQCVFVLFSFRIYILSFKHFLGYISKLE